MVEVSGGSRGSINVNPKSNTGSVDTTTPSAGSSIETVNNLAKYYEELAKQHSIDAQQSATSASNSASQASISETNAETSASEALASENNAATSETNAEIWAEGTDEEVETLGGEHSAKGWADYVVNNAPEATVTQTETGATITTKDLTHGEVSVEILNGEKGEPGTDGQDGADGYSPSATVVETQTGATITITDKDGTTTADITNGTDGTDGVDGEDGFSPIATVTQTTTGATITITDESGTTTADITNGIDGEDGTDGTNATITGATASVDNTVGTPSVVVTSGGTESARSFDFAFSHLKGIQGEQGIQGVQGEKGETGETGPTGPQGIQGEAATIQVGTVTTVGYDQPATVTNVGTEEEAIFNFEIPRGVPGSSAGIEAGEAIDVTGDVVSVKYDNSTIKLNSSNQIYTDFPQYLSVERLGNYIFKATFDYIPEYDATISYQIGGNCTSFVSDGKLYRNFDWKYDNTADFVVVCKNFQGMASIIGMNDGELDAKKIEQLPYHLVDGVNSDGIMVSAHVLYNDWEYTGAGNKDHDITLLPYYILNNLHDISSINTVLGDFVNNIQIPTALIDAEYLMQFVVTDGTTTYCIMPPQNATGSYIIQNITSNPKLTNFRWVSDATVVRANLQERPTGVERWNEVSTSNLNDLRFTKCYEAPTRLSEFIGIDDTDKDSTDAELTEIYNKAHAEYLIRTRDGKLWQTVHSIVFNGNSIEHLWVQENWDKDYIAGGGNVDDVKVNGVSVVSDKIANIDLTGKQDTLIAGNGIDITNNKVSNSIHYVITEDMFDLEFDDTKGVAPYSTSYGYTNVTIHEDTGIEWLEGAIYQFILDTKVSVSANRNVRIRIGETGAWLPLCVPAGTIASGSSWFIKTANAQMTYKTTVIETGALHLTGYDTNTTYTLNYLQDAGQYKSGVGSNAITRYSICLQKPDGTWEKCTDTSRAYSTAVTKAVNPRGFVLNQIKYYGTTTVLANGALCAASVMRTQASSVDMRYSTNCGASPDWTVGEYLYFVGRLKEDGLFYLEPGQWWTNELPTTNDGKLYIQLGSVLTTGSYNITLLATRPIYYHDGTAIREYVVNAKQNYLTAGDNISIQRKGEITVGKNLFDLNKAIEGAYITSANAVTASTGYAYSNHIEIPQDATHLTFNATGGTLVAASTCFYDDDYVFISGVKGDSRTFPYVYTLPQNARYVVVSFQTKFNDIQLEVGQEATEYEPYQETVVLNETISALHDNTKQNITDNTLTTTSKTIVGAINEVNAKPSMPSLDEVTITTNSDDELQAIGVIDSSDNSTALKTWTGTKAEYDAIATKDSNTLYNITDDSDITLSLLETIYPVGSIYITTNNTCPLSALFGTWSLVAQDRVLQGAGLRGAVGTTLEESLPNIKSTGTIGGGGRYYGGGNANSALYGSNFYNTAPADGNYGANGNLNFDASRYSSTYQDNAPVQPDAYLVNIYRRVA